MVEFKQLRDRSEARNGRRKRRHGQQQHEIHGQWVGLVLSLHEKYRSNTDHIDPEVVRQKRNQCDHKPEIAAAAQVNFTEQEQRTIDATEANELADEQAFLDWFNLLEDNPVPAKCAPPPKLPLR